MALPRAGEANRIEQYLGPIGGESGAGAMVSGAGYAPANGIYQNTGDGRQFAVGGSGLYIAGGPGAWTMYQEGSPGSAPIAYYASTSASLYGSTWTVVNDGSTPG